MTSFQDILSEDELEVFRAAGYGQRAGFGRRPVLAVVDVNYNFCGDRPEPLLESVKRWRNSCGAEGWAAAERIAEVIRAARAAGVPIVYSTGEAPRPDGLNSGRWGDKNSRRHEDADRDGPPANEILPVIAPQESDLMIVKPKPSIFFGTQFLSVLVELGADSVIVCGTTTSGCIRASVIDGFSYNFRMSVIEECTFDRGQLSHRVNLFDMDQKYADVVSMRETQEFFGTLADGHVREGEPAHGRV